MFFWLFINYVFIVYCISSILQAQTTQLLDNVLDKEGEHTLEANGFRVKVSVESWRSKLNVSKHALRASD